MTIDLDRARAAVAEQTAVIAQLDRDLTALRNRRFDATQDRDRARRLLADLEWREARDKEMVPA